MLMSDIVGGVTMRPNAKGSSKPNEEPNLESLVRKKITSDLIYKDGSKKVDVVKIKEVILFSIKKGEFLVPSIKENRQLMKYDYALEGDAQIEINQYVRSASPKRIRGFFNINDKKEIDMYKIIQIS